MCKSHTPHACYSSPALPLQGCSPSSSSIHRPPSHPPPAASQLLLKIIVPADDSASAPPPARCPPPCTAASPPDISNPRAHTPLPPSVSLSARPSSPHRAPGIRPPDPRPSPRVPSGNAPADWLAGSTPHSSDAHPHTPARSLPRSSPPALQTARG